MRNVLFIDGPLRNQVLPVENSSIAYLYMAPEPIALVGAPLQSSPSEDPIYYTLGKVVMFDVLIRIGYVATEAPSNADLIECMLSNTAKDALRGTACGTVR